MIKYILNLMNCMAFSIYLLNGFVLPDMTVNARSISPFLKNRRFIDDMGGEELFKSETVTQNKVLSKEFLPGSRGSVINDDLEKSKLDLESRYYGPERDYKDHPLYYYLMGRQEEFDRDSGSNSKQPELTTKLLIKNDKEINHKDLIFADRARNDQYDTDKIDQDYYYSNNNPSETDNKENFGKAINDSTRNLFSSSESLDGSHNADNQSSESEYFDKELWDRLNAERKFYVFYLNDSQKIVQEIDGENVTVYLDFDDSYYISNNDSNTSTSTSSNEDNLIVPFDMENENDTVNSSKLLPSINDNSNASVDSIIYVPPHHSLQDLRATDFDGTSEEDHKSSIMTKTDANDDDAFRILNPFETFQINFTNDDYYTNNNDPLMSQAADKYLELEKNADERSTTTTVGNILIPHDLLMKLVENHYKSNSSSAEPNTLFDSDMIHESPAPHNQTKFLQDNLYYDKDYLNDEYPGMLQVGEMETKTSFITTENSQISDTRRRTLLASNIETADLIKPSPFAKPIHKRCFELLDPGNCGKHLEMWHFDSTSLSCVSFEYNGCGKSLNIFATLNSCKHYCMASRKIDYVW